MCLNSREPASQAGISGGSTHRSLHCIPRQYMQRSPFGFGRCVQTMQGIARNGCQRADVLVVRDSPPNMGRNKLPMLPSNRCGASGDRRHQRRTGSPRFGEVQHGKGHIEFSGSKGSSYSHFTGYILPATLVFSRAKRVPIFS